MTTDTNFTPEYSTKEEVAFKLVQVVVKNVPNQYHSKHDILSLFSECLLAARDPQGYLGGTYKNILNKSTISSQSYNPE